MTRREELLRVSRVAVNTFQNDIDGPFVLPSGHKNVLIQRIYGVLLQVEREVWESVMTHIRAVPSDPHMTSTGTLLLLHKWAREQKEAL